MNIILTFFHSSLLFSAVALVALLILVAIRKRLSQAMRIWMLAVLGWFLLVGLMGFVMEFFGRRNIVDMVGGFFFAPLGIFVYPLFYVTEWELRDMWPMLFLHPVVLVPLMVWMLRKTRLNRWVSRWI